ENLMWDMVDKLEISLEELNKIVAESLVVPEPKDSAEVAAEEMSKEDYDKLSKYEKINLKQGKKVGAKAGSAGNEYYYDDETFDGSDAAFEEDNTQGPGNEIWLSPQAMPGDYEVYLNMYAKNDDQPVRVRGSILHQNGRSALPETTLSSEGQKPLVVTFTVDDEGSVTIR
ncbi:MAG: hypothetical protein JKY29_01735, partial [Gammaproteobacteria bacterium]|nr:hypothetical protein [Gammaproteobacteria bacterium]